MFTLFIDTHSKNVVIVLYKDNKVLLKKEKTSDSSHSSVLMPLIEEMLKEANILPKDLNNILVVNGPGSFTGIRIGVTAAKTLAYVLDIEIREIDFFQVLLSSYDNKIKKQVVISDPKGYYMALFDESNKLTSDYNYVSLKKFCEKKDYVLIKENIDIDYEKVYHFSQKLPVINPHLIKPLYVKKIEVEK